ncbi:MAG: histidine kinase [Burkholderiaceae bacterium]|nr:histidine kinase [Burkholderiaceae bacterium]
MRSIEAQGRSPPPRAARPSWLAGATWNGVALVALICVVNGTRRAVRGFGEQSWLESVLSTLQLSALGLLVAVPVALAVLLSWNLAPKRPVLRYPLLALAVAASSLLGSAALHVVEALALCDSPQECWGGASHIANTWSRYGSLSALFAAVFVFIRLADESAERAADAERNRARFAQREEEARLRMLQAQIEPHFLFNTLANVRRLYQTDPAAGEAMLGNLLRYLAVALPQMRAATSTLAREAALAESFLEIQRIRMGTRLAFEFDIPAALRDAALPPMMLLTLVENAIKHGLAPLPEGGSVRISAVADGPELVLRVADTGRGFAQSSGGGTGLANIRARLAGHYGSAAHLALALNTPRGVTATIAVPLSPQPRVAPS